MSSLTRLYRQIAALDSLTEADQHRIWKHAVAVKDTRLAAMIAERDDLPQSLREVVSSHPAAEVRRTWLSRSDVTEADVMASITGESRVTVLAAIAAFEGLPADAYRHLARQHKHRIALTLTHTAGVPDDCADDVAIGLLKYPSPYQRTHLVRQWVGAHPHTIRVVYERDPSLGRAIAVQNPEVVPLLGLHTDPLVQSLIKQVARDLDNNQAYAIHTAVAQLRVVIVAAAPGTLQDHTIARIIQLGERVRAANPSPAVAETYQTIIETLTPNDDESLYTRAARTGNEHHITAAILAEPDMSDERLGALLATSYIAAPAALTALAEGGHDRLAERVLALNLGALRGGPRTAAYEQTIRRILVSTDDNRVREVITRWTQTNRIELDATELLHTTWAALGATDRATACAIVLDRYPDETDLETFATFAEATGNASLQELFDLTDSVQS